MVDFKGFKFSVAPMMDWTDRHCRVFHRLMTRQARLYTEMLTTGAILHGDRRRLLGFDASEHPVALQLGGSDPRDLATAAKIGEDFGYDEINLNVGCPSDRVKDGRFGACLMAEPALVAMCVEAMKRTVQIPVTVKCRIGIDDQDPEIALDALARGVIAAGADALIVHARKAWLNGLSPKENRDIPPLDYDRVYRLKAALPEVPIIINGGIAGVAEARAHLAYVDGAMLGRAAYQEPWRLLTVDPEIFGEPAPHATMKDVFAAMMPYIEDELARARGCTRSRGISSARFMACRARAPSVVISLRTASSPAPASKSCAMRSRWSRIALRLRSPRDRRISGIAAQHQPVGADFPTFQPVQKAHAEQIGSHLSVRHHQRRHGTLDELADGEAIERQACRLGVSAGGLDIDVVFEQFQRQAGGLGRFIGQHDGRRAGVDHHRSVDAIDPGLQRKFTTLPARDLDGPRWRRRPLAQQFRNSVAGSRDPLRIAIGDHGAGRRQQDEYDKQNAAHSGPRMQILVERVSVSRELVRRTLVNRTWGRQPLRAEAAARRPPSALEAVP